MPSVTPLGSLDLSTLRPIAHETIIENGREVEVYPESSRVTVLAPAYDGVTVDFLESYGMLRDHCLARFRQADGTIAIKSIIAGRVGIQGDSHVDRTRNHTLNIWVEKNPHRTDLAYWWDVDIPFEHPDQFAHLWSLAMMGYQFFGGLYAVKSIVPTFVCNVKNTKNCAPDPATGMVEVLHLGTGSMMWHRDVPLALQRHPEVKPYVCAPNSPFPGAKHYAYFSSGVYGPPEKDSGLPQWQSEDWKVCMLWQELGGKVFADTRVKLRHRGGMTYPPSVTDLQAAMEALLRGHHPKIKIDTLREAIAKYQPTPVKDAA